MSLHSHNCVVFFICTCTWITPVVYISVCYFHKNNMNLNIHVLLENGFSDTKCFEILKCFDHNTYTD